MNLNIASNIGDSNEDHKRWTVTIENFIGYNGFKQCFLIVQFWKIFDNAPKILASKKAS